MPALVATLISSGLLLAGFACLRAARPSPGWRVLFGLGAWISLLLYTAYWVIDHLSGDGINDAAWYHLTYGLRGAGFAEFAGIISAGAVALLTGTTVCWIAAFSGARLRRSHPRLTALACALAFASILPNPALRDVAGHLWPAAPEAASFRRLYQKPRIQETRAEHPNLVYIYAEGMERTYLDETIFPGLTPGLRALEAEAVSFTDVRQVGMTGYTIAGIVASQCGIPLSPQHLEGNRMASVDKYLPGAGGLGDLLHAEGYHLVYMGGAPLWFAGKGIFFKTHGFDEVLGREELMPLVEDSTYRNGWGLYDDSLLDLAYTRFDELSREGRRFGLFLLTLDTHPPDGHRSRSGADIVHGDGSNPMLNAVKVSDRLISQFVARLRASPHAANTVVVVASDHLAMPNTATAPLEQGHRRNLFLVLEPGRSAPVQVDRRGSTLDIGPTLLPFLGYTGAIGLGRDLRDARVPPAETEEIADAVDRGVWRDEIARFWEFPALRHVLAIDTAASTAALDGRTFWIPMLVRLGPGMTTDLEFAWDLKGADRAIVQAVQRMPADTPFVLIDRSENVRDLGHNVGGSEWCLIAGRGQTIHTAIGLGAKAQFSRDEILTMTGATAP